MNNGNFYGPDEVLAARRKALEESFFRRRDAELLERLRNECQLEAKRMEFQRASGFDDPKLLDRLIHLQMDSATVAALALAPLVCVAWADGKLDEREQQAILEAAVESGMDKNSASYHWLQTWLKTKPDGELIRTWKEFVEALWKTISEDDRRSLRDGIVSRTEYVAKAAGGFLGLGNRISEAEQKVLDELKQLLPV